DEAVARTEFSDRLRDENDDRRAKQIEEGRRPRDQRGRPAGLFVEFGEIDGLAVEAERSAAGPDPKADRDNTPVVVPTRGFIDRDVSWSVHVSFPAFLSVVPVNLPGIHPLPATGIVKHKLGRSGRLARSDHFDADRSVSRWHQLGCGAYLGAFLRD